MTSEQKERDMSTRTAVQNPAATLREAAERLWRHGESECGTVIPPNLCFALATQFDCAVDEWHYGATTSTESMELQTTLANECLAMLDT